MSFIGRYNYLLGVNVYVIYISVCGVNVIIDMYVSIYTW